MDEPNSALDAEGSEALNKAIAELKKQEKAVIIMTHRPLAISQCDNLAVIKQGSIRMYGPRDEVLKKVLKNVPGVSQVSN